MKNPILIFLFQLIFLNIFAQEYQYIPFPDSNAVWSEIHYNSISETKGSWVYYKFAFLNNDTIINDISYHILFQTQTNTVIKNNPVIVGFIREDSLKKVWFKYNIQGIPPNTNKFGEYLLYDFGVNVGDTLSEHDDYFQCRTSIVLDSIGFINFQGRHRKVYFFDFSWEVWIEGIGKIKGLIYHSGGIPTNGENNHLICMHQNDTLLYYYPGKYNQYDDCLPSFVVDGARLLTNSDIKVYPNPVTNGIVYFENLSFETLELFDTTGNITTEKNISGKARYELNVCGFPPGVYTYRLESKGLIPTLGKLIIQSL